MQETEESMAEFSKFCLEIQLANNFNNDENKAHSQELRTSLHADDVLLMIDVEPRDARWWVMAEDDKLVRYNSGFYPNYTKIRANSMKFTKILISLASLSYSSLSNQYKKHAGVQDTTTTDTSSLSSNKIHALITITDTECGISPFVLLVY
ncbi:hypothetical protein GLOIN_2v1884741 [Rhizophagus irregularis DAOM 181602=DAOM 197198]|nr:hypothetical protein GLOIN_2v1884741 [Rhizophagus irregularis DAOM 181602=DAOM 197198]